MADTDLAAENAMLRDQLAQLHAGLLQYRQMAGLAGPLGQSQQFATGPNSLMTSAGQLTQGPVGLNGTLPGAGTFGPQGVLFTGGSPWPVSARPAQITNSLVGLNQALMFLKRSGLLDKMLGQGQQPQTQTGIPNDPSQWPSIPPIDLGQY